MNRLESLKIFVSVDYSTNRLAITQIHDLFAVSVSA